MKILSITRINILLVTLAIILSISSCSNDFLDEGKTISAQINDTIKMTDMESAKTVILQLPEKINAKWHIAQFPVWLKLSQLEGVSSNGKMTIDLQVPNRYLIQELGAVTVPLIFEVEGLGYIQYPFQILNYGYPSPFVSTQQLNIGYKIKDGFFIRNMNQGILTWEIIHKPEWLTVSKTKGYLGSSEEDILSVIISRDNLAKGNYSDDIIIKVNTPEGIKKVNVTMDVLDLTFSGQVTAIQGDVIDADFNQNTGLLAFATQNPNRLYYMKSGQPLLNVELNRVPTSLDISELGDHLAITFTNTDLSVYNCENMQPDNTLKTGIIAEDVVLGDNGWAYLCPPNYSTNYLLSINLSSGTIIQHKENLNGLTLLKKVPGKNLIYGSKVGWGPDFLFVFDISKGPLSEVFDQYFMEVWNFWFSNDGSRIFTGLKQVYNSPQYLQVGYTDKKPVLAGQYSLSGTITAIGHSASSGEIFVTYKPMGANGTTIAIFDDQTYVSKESIQVNNVMVIENDYLLDLYANVPYMYADKNGKELYVLKNGVSSYPKTFWYLEKIKRN